MWKTQRSTVKGYFLAGGQMVWWPVSTFIVTLLVSLGYSKTEKHFCPNRTYFSKQKERKEITSMVCKDPVIILVGFFPIFKTGAADLSQGIATALHPCKSQPCRACPILHALIGRFPELTGWSPSLRGVFRLGWASESVQTNVRT